MPKKKKKRPGDQAPALYPVGSDDTSGQGADGLMVEMESPRAVLQRLHDWVRNSFHGEELRREAYVDNMKMLSNDQWPEESKAERATDQRPMLVFNKTTKNILTLAGVQAQTGTEPHLLPFEPGDVVPTEIMSLLIRNVRERTAGRMADRSVFIDKIGGNLGFWKVWMDYAKRPQGDFRIDRLPPLTVYTDPNWMVSGNWDDCRYVLEQTRLPVDQAMEEYPEQREEIRRLAGEFRDGTVGLAFGLTDELMGDTLATERMFWDRETQRVSVFEAWWKQTIRTEIAIYLDNEEVEDNPEIVKRLKEETKGIPKKDRDAKIVFVRRPVTIVKTAHFLGNILLGPDDDDLIRDTPYPIAELPYFPALGYLFWKTPISLTDIMKDPQREKNKRRTSLIEMVGRMPLSGYFNDASVGADPQEIIEFSHGHGVVINHRGKEPTPIKAPELPQAVVMLEQLADKEIDSTVNVNAELLGQTTQTTVSGKAIEARQRGGLLTHEILFTTFKEDVARYTKFLIKLIQEFMTPAEALRILGAYAIREPDNEQLQSLGELDDLGILEALDRSFSIEYDVVIGSKSYDPTHKMAEAQILTELRQAGVMIPDAALIEVLGENGTLSKATAEKIIQGLQQAAGALQAGQPAPGAPAAPTPEEAAATAA